MGFIFNNIAQLAGHLINESDSKSKTKNALQESGENVLDFAAILGSAQHNRKSNPMLEGLSQIGREIEVKEKAEIPISIIKAAISNNKDKVTILISAEQLKGLLAKLNLTLSQQPQSPQSPANPAEQISSIISFMEKIPGSEPLQLSFNPSNIFDAAGKIKTGDMPIDLAGLDDIDDAKIDIKALIKLIGEYSDPIDLELSDSFSADELTPDFSNPINKNNSTLDAAQGTILKSSFAFDLRGIVNGLDKVVNTNIKGILTQSQKTNNDNSTGLPKISGNVTDISFMPVNSEKFKIIGDVMARNMAPEINKLSMKDLLSGFGINENIEISPLKNGQQFEHFVNRVNAIFKESLSSDSENSINDQFFHIRSKDITQNAKLKTQDGVKTGSLPGVENKIPVNFVNNTKAVPIDSKLGNTQSVQDSNPGQLQDDNTETVNNISLKPEFLFAKNMAGKILSVPKIVDIESIKTSIMHAVGNNLTSLKLRLRPEKLGNIDIRMIWKNDAVSITLKAETSEAARIMTSNLADLKSGLENANFKINEIGVVLDNTRNHNNYNPENREFANSTANGGGHQKRSGSEFSNNVSKRQQTDFLSDSRSENSASVIRGWVDLKA